MLHGYVSDTLTADEDRILKSSILLQLCSLVPWRNAYFLNGIDFCLKIAFWFNQVKWYYSEFLHKKGVCECEIRFKKNSRRVKKNKEHFHINILILTWWWNIYLSKDHTDSALHNSGLNFGESAPSTFLAWSTSKLMELFLTCPLLFFLT